MRREIENYLFDKEVVSKLAAIDGRPFDETRYNAAVSDIGSQDLKPVQQEVQASCGYVGTIADFKVVLARAMTQGMNTFAELESAIFP